MGFKSATIYLVRHGETVGNDTKLVMHPEEDVLNDAGKLQAASLGAKLKEVEFNQIYTSNYPRTIETASIILSQNLKNTLVPSKIDERLREFGSENSYNKPYADLLRALIKFLHSERPLDEFSVDGSEPIPEIRARTKGFLMDLIRDVREWTGTTGPTFLITSHGACIRLLLEHFTDASLFWVEGWEEWGLRVPRNTASTKFTIHVPDGSEEGDNKIRVVFQHIHDFSHIPKELMANDSLTRLANTPEGKSLSGCIQV